MASSGEGGEGGEGNSRAVDPTPGTLVWIRRRNGSWWPGRIMRLDEFPEACVHSSRSGTPIKLLGRDDASVDWYNLERSKRVKPFRCGEYDGCIEKARAAAAANPNKKAAKYARREDAIIHALKLENALKIEDQDEDDNEPELFSRMDISGSEEDGSSLRDDPTISDSAADIDGSDDVSDSEETSTSARELSQSGISFEEPKHIRGPKVESMDAGRRKTPNDSDDDGIEGIKRMRGLGDLGDGKVREIEVHPTEIIKEFEQDINQNGGLPSLKRKRSQVAHMHEFLKKKSRHRPLAKVLESTELVNVPVTYEEFVILGASTLHKVPSKLSALESNDTAKNLSGVINNSSDSTCASFEHESGVSNSRNKSKEHVISSMVGWFEDDSSEGLFDVPFVEEEGIYSTGFPDMFKSSCGKPKVCTPAKQSGQGTQSEAILLTNEGIYESGFNNSEAAFDTISQRMERATSRWQSKGKRKARYITNKNIKRELEDFVDPDKISFDSSPTHKRSLPYRQSRFLVNPKYQFDDYPTKIDGYESCLYEVDIEVKANYRPQHVPLVSLMSKLNGKAIVGHPLTVEVIDEGSSDQFIKLSVELANIEKSKKVSSPGAARYSRGKPPKAKRGGVSSKKTRKLSSLNRCQKLTIENRQSVVEKLKAPAIKCIPLNVVFSRLNEALKSA